MPFRARVFGLTQPPSRSELLSDTTPLRGDATMAGRIAPRDRRHGAFTRSTRRRTVMITGVGKRPRSPAPGSERERHFGAIFSHRA